VAQVTQELLPLALGVAISPIPIIIVITMLLSEKAGATSRGFLVGWVLSIGVACIALSLLGGVTEQRRGTLLWKGNALLALVLGAVVLLVALGTWRRRPRDGRVPTLPRWLATVDQLSFRKAVGLGVLLFVVNPKNLLLSQVSGTTIAQGQLSARQQFWAVLLFTVIAAATIALPVVLYAAAKHHLGEPLKKIRSGVSANSSAITTLLMTVIATVLIANGIRGLS